MNKVTIPTNSLLIAVLFLVLSQLTVQGQSLKHPHIWASDSDKAGILYNIANYDWAESMFDQLKDRNVSKKDAHLANPSAFLSNLTTIPGNRDSHREDLNTAAECAVLYYLTNDEGYAQFSADIIYHYMKRVSVQDPMTIYFFGDLGDSDNHHIMTREDFPRIAISYDFIHSFISKSGTTVYDLISQSRVPFDFAIAQKSLEVMVENVLMVGGINSNHPLLELAGGLYSALCMDDDAIRKSYFDRLWNGDKKQNGISWMVDHFAKDGDIWPESMGYSKGVHDIMLRVLNVIDRYDPAANYINDNLRLLDGAFVFENFKYPNNAIMAYGDSHRDESATDHIVRYVQTIAHRKGLLDYEQKAASVLKAQYELQKGYNPKITTERLNWDTPLELLWGVNVADTTDASGIPLYTTVQAKFAGIVMQRNYVPANNMDYGLMYYTGGATYVHAHASGLDMEIYGAGYVIGPDYGRGTYGSDIHEQYIVSPAAHNTVIVNGVSRRGLKTNGKGTWQNIVDEIVLESCEPKVYGDPISKHFCFSSQFLDDSFNDCKQLRTNSIVRTSATSGYYIDIFRSKSNAANDYHDYLFHGLGDAMTIKKGSTALPLSSTSQRYKNDIGDDRKQPGWRWFSEAKTSAGTTEAVSVRFDINKDGKYLHVNMPEGASKEYSSVLSPPTKEVRNGYDRKDTRVFAMRQHGEAWNKPFVAVYEPSGNAASTVKSVENITIDGRVVGLIVTSKVGSTELTDYVLSPDQYETLTLPEYNMAFTGRFAIIRKQLQTENSETVTMYIGEGETLSYGDNILQGDTEKKASKVFYGVPILDEKTQLTLTTRVLGSGGRIAVSPDKATYSPGEQAVVTAIPEEGFVIDTWLGDAKGDEDDYTIYFYANRSVNVRFRYAEYFNLNVTSANGTVNQSVEGVEHPERQKIELTAVPDARYEFVGWTGDVLSDENPLNIRVTSNLNIVANYRELELYKLNLTIVGNGKVDLLPEQDEYLVGTKVTVFAQANDEDSFVNWTGDYTSRFTAIYLIMDSAITITANFSGASGIKDSPLQNTKLYPNPNNGVMQLSTTDVGVCSYVVLDIQGRVVQVGDFQAQTTLSIDQKGYYFIQIKTLDYSKTLKVLVLE